MLFTTAFCLNKATVSNVEENMAAPHSYRTNTISLCLNAEHLPEDCQEHLLDQLQHEAQYRKDIAVFAELENSMPSEWEENKRILEQIGETINKYPCKKFVLLYDYHMVGCASIVRVIPEKDLLVSLELLREFTAGEGSSVSSSKYTIAKLNERKWGDLTDILIHQNTEAFVYSDYTSLCAFMRVLKIVQK